jgi:IS1 family transposase
VINTDFIERLNATFRQRLARLARRSRNLAHQAETLVAGMYSSVASITSPEGHRDDV